MDDISKNLASLILPTVVTEVKTDESDIILSDEQKLKILKLWDENPKMAVRDVVKAIWGDIDSRTMKGRLVREFIVEKKLDFAKWQVPVEKAEVVLTEQQQEFIRNNCAVMKIMEMAKVLFPNVSIGPVSKETIEVKKYLKEFNPKSSQDNLDDISDETDYAPPKTLQRAADRVNKYILDCIKVEEIKTSATLQKNLKALIKFCHLNRFKMLVDNYTSKRDKAIFEGSYIRYIWDKPDLTEEELDLYINLSSGIVDNMSMKAELQNLQGMFQDCADDSESKRISMSIVESIENIRKAIDDNEKRQKELVNVLQGKRTQRIDIRTKQDHSLIQLVEYVRNYDNRQQLLLLAKKRQGDVKEEIKRMENMSDAIIQIWGTNGEEII